jgi:beta-N-acetylhexosaminidase
VRPGKLAIAAVLCALAAAGAAIALASEGEPQGPDTAAPQASSSAADDLTPKQLTGQRIVCGFDGRSAPSGLLRVLRRGELAGVILFDDNIGSRKAVRRMNRALQATRRPPGLRDPLLISVDQEGGLVKRLPGPPKSSAQVMGAMGAAYSRRQGAATGKSLRGVGINVDLAPVLDVARRGGFIDEQMRAFGRKAGAVSRAGVAFARGLESQGVAATAKHFPGLGATSANTDLRPSTIRLGAGTLRKVDERPYDSYVAARGDLVMVSSARYPALGTGKLPASQSKRLIRRELRDRLGFEGVTITDSLEAPGARVGASAAKVATRAAAAGSDLLLYVHCDAGMRAALALRRALASGRLDRSAFEESVDRILALRAGLGG